ncbi:MAG TPA: sigma-70 family RNA polymerase sigma factor [Anaerolineae bacterium]|nr:sigma-70 family RNA polymerase sigma factor [Anaerolineae bacterium]
MPGMEYAQLDDAMLVTLVARRDEAALAALYDRYSRLVYSVAMRIVGQRQLAEDITLDSFQRVWQAAGTFRRERGRFVTWLISVTRHRAIDELRRLGVRPEGASVELNQGIDTGSSREDSVEDVVWLAYKREAVRRALAGLPQPQREALELAYFCGLTQQEIAERLTTPLGTVKTRMRMGMQKLRRALEEADAVD